nr:mechanosensitive ion channel domain-containing protein [Acinetobacter larvae]
MFVHLAILILLAMLANFVAKHIVVRGIRSLINRFKFKNTPIFAQHSVIRRIANIVPAVIILNGISTVPHLTAKLVDLVQLFAQAFIILTIALSISELLNVFNLMYQKNAKSRDKPIKGYLQLIKLLVFIVCTLLIVGTFLKKDIFTLLAGFGAMAAVLMLVFQNTILSLVASVQIASYDMVRIGDWIEMPSLNADGTVVDMSLHTVTVENFDRTFTTIPTNKLVVDTFKNWRGMFDAGVRRIKRSIFIDQTSVHLLTQQEIEKLRELVILNPYLDEKQAELEQFNQQFSAQSHWNMRQLTNIGTFRAYIKLYLAQHPGIAETQTLMVRQLQPTAEGIPLEIYAFTNNTAWVAYEGIQADIFDHILAIAPYFSIRIYQAPSGSDVKSLALAPHTTAPNV